MIPEEQFPYDHEFEKIGGFTARPGLVAAFQAEDGSDNKLYLFEGNEDPNLVSGHLLTIMPGSEERVLQAVEVPRSRFIETHELFLRLKNRASESHTNGERVAVAAFVSIGAIAVGTLFVRKLHKK